LQQQLSQFYSIR